MRALHQIRTKEAITGLLFIGIGTLFLIYALQYGLGTMRRIGPGFIPLAVSAFLIGIGLVLILLTGRLVEDRIEFPQLRGLSPVLAIVLFGLTIKPLGLLGATLIAVICARRAERGRPRIEEAILGCVFAVLSYLIFVVGLNMPIDFWPKFL